MLDSRAEDLSYWLQSEDNITNPFKESAMFTGKIAKSAGTQIGSNSSVRSNVSVNTLKKLAQLQPSDVQALQTQGAAITPAIQQIVKQIGRQDLLTAQKKEFKTGNTGKDSQILKKQLLSGLQQINSDIKAYKGRKMVSNGQKARIAQSIQNMKYVDLPETTTTLTNPGSLSFSIGRFGNQNNYPKLQKYTPNQTLLNYNTSQIIDAIEKTRFATKTSSVLPQVFAKQQKRQTLMDNQDKYIKALQTQRLNKKSQYFTKLGDAVVWQDNHWGIANDAARRKYDSFVTKGQRKNVSLDLSNVLMDKYVAESNLETYIPNMVKEIVKANTLFSVAGIGPISKNSLPFYAGRYIDKVSGRIRVLPNPTSKYINPLSYKARMSYLQARILNNWNKYVQSQEQYYDLLGNAQDIWEKKQKAALKKALMANEKNREAAFAWMQGQIVSYKLGIPVSTSSRIVLGTAQQKGKLNQLQAQVTKFAKLKQKVTSNNLEEFATYLQTLATSVMSGIQNTAVGTQKKRKIANAYGTWMEKGYQKNADTVKKLLRAQLPSTLSAQDITKAEQQMNNWKSVFDKANITMDQTSIDKYISNKPAGSMQEFAKISKQMQQAVNAKYDRFSTPYQKKPEQKRVTNQQFDYIKPGRQGLKIADL